MPILLLNHPEPRKMPWFFFCIDWEQRKLGDFFEERNERSGEGELISVTISSGIQRYADLGRFDTKPSDMSNYKKVEVGDIAYNSMRMWQGASGFSPYSGILSPAYTVIRPREGVSSLFFSYLLKRPQMIHLFKINSQGLTPDTWNLKYPAFSRIEASAPIIREEQDKIADILCRIDDLITLHQRKQKWLCPANLKRKIRPKMAIYCEQRKLGELVERVVRKNTNNESTLPLTISAQYGLVDQFTYFNNRVASRDVSNYYLLYKGEFAYNKSTSDGFPFGTVKRLDLYEKGVLSTLYIVFSIKKENQSDSDFLTVFFDTDRWHKGVSERAAEGARNHGLLNISADDFFDIDLAIPKNKNEQTAIGKFICCLDNLITLHQRKQKWLCPANLKRKIRPKMAIYWEQRKFGETVYRVGEMSDAMGLPRVEYEDIEAGQGTLNKDLKDKFSVKKGVLFQSGDILYGKLRPYLKNWLFAQFSGIAVGDFWVLRSNSVEHGFIYRLIQTPTFDYVANQSAGSKMPRADWNLLSKTEFMFPLSNKEQEAIGRIFLELDNLITLHQRE